MWGKGIGLKNIYSQESFLLTEQETIDSCQDELGLSFFFTLIMAVFVTVILEYTLISQYIVVLLLK